MQIRRSKPPGGIRSLVCDCNGIVIAETVYRCMICAELFDVIDDIHQHYQLEHYEDKFGRNAQDEYIDCAPKIDYEDDDFDNALLTTSQYSTSALATLAQDPDSSGDEENGPFVKASLTNGGGAAENLFASKSVKFTSSKGGYVTCEVCRLTKFYSHISRRYGVFSCESCAKFFYRYCQKPVHFSCPNNGNCPLNIDLPGARCKACLLEACLKKYILDPRKHPKIFTKESAVVEDNYEDSDGDQATASSSYSLPQKSVPQTSNIGPNKAPSQKTHSQSRKIKVVSPSPPHTLTEGDCQSPSEQKDALNLTKPPFPLGQKRKCEDSVDSAKIRRAPCRQCVGCLADDCGKCLYCLDKPKFGGNDVKKQKCIRRRCRGISSQ